MMRVEKKAVWGWVLYDWANSAYVTTVMAGFFPIFFKEYCSAGTDVNTSTALLGFGNSMASLVVALISPVLGAIADKGSRRKKFLASFAYMGVLMTASLFFLEKGAWAPAVFIYVMGTVGFSGANVFYDSLLPMVSTESNIDYVSGLGYSMGYLGGGLLFLLNVFMCLMPEKFGFSDSSEAVKWAFLTVALWWGVFTVFILLWVQETPEREQVPSLKEAVYQGFSQLAATFRKVRHLKPVMMFLLAYWCYIDGVDTIVRMAVDYGLSIGFDSKVLITALLIVQFVGFPATLVFGKLGQKWDVRKAIYLAIGFYALITCWGVFMERQEEFYILAVMIGLVQGGIQALSRSYYARLIPKGQWAEFYGFYNMLGKFSAIMGPALMGLIGLKVKAILMPSAPTPAQIEAIGRTASRWSLASIIVFFIAGGILLHFVKKAPGPERHFS